MASCFRKSEEKWHSWTALKRATPLQFTLQITLNIIKMLIIEAHFAVLSMQHCDSSKHISCWVESQCCDLRFRSQHKKGGPTAHCIHCSLERTIRPKHAGERGIKWMMSNATWKRGEYENVFDASREVNRYASSVGNEPYMWRLCPPIYMFGTTN